MSTPILSYDEERLIKIEKKRESLNYLFVRGLKCKSILKLCWYCIIIDVEDTEKDLRIKRNDPRNQCHLNINNVSDQVLSFGFTCRLSLQFFAQLEWNRIA